MPFLFKTVFQNYPKSSPNQLIKGTPHEVPWWRRTRRRRRTTLIKSNNPHLAGGEKRNPTIVLVLI
jgi:uncharacterized phage-associated protein